MADPDPERGRVDLLNVRPRSSRALFVGGDEPLPAPMIERLALYGIDVDRAATVDEAVRMMSRRSFDYAAVVVGDPVEPVGFEFARRLSMVNPRTAVVVWTESAMRTWSPSVDVLRRPCTPGRMATTLSRAIERVLGLPA